MAEDLTSSTGSVRKALGRKDLPRSLSSTSISSSGSSTNKIPSGRHEGSMNPFALPVGRAAVTVGTPLNRVVMLFCRENSSLIRVTKNGRLFADLHSDHVRAKLTNEYRFALYSVGNRLALRSVEYGKFVCRGALFPRFVFRGGAPVEKANGTVDVTLPQRFRLKRHFLGYSTDAGEARYWYLGLGNQIFPDGSEIQRSRFILMQDSASTRAFDNAASAPTSLVPAPNIVSVASGALSRAQTPADAGSFTPGPSISLRDHALMLDAGAFDQAPSAMDPLEPLAAYQRRKQLVSSASSPPPAAAAGVATHGDVVSSTSNNGSGLNMNLLDIGSSSGSALTVGSSGSSGANSPQLANTIAALALDDSLVARMTTNTPEQSPKPSSKNKPPKKALVRSNSTSSLYIRDTISNPDINELCFCIATALVRMIEAGHSIENKVYINEFDESKYPLHVRNIVTDDVYEGGGMLSPLPTEEDLFMFISPVFHKLRVKPATGVLMMCYIDRLQAYTKLTIDTTNWRRVVISSLILATKVFEELTVFNTDFRDVLPKLSAKDLKKMEMHLLTLLQYNVSVTSGTYAKYFFALREMSELDPEQFPLAPLDTTQLTKMEARGANSEKEIVQKLTRSASVMFSSADRNAAERKSPFAILS